MAALMVAAFLSFEKQRFVRGSLALAVGTLMKLYPAAAIPIVLWQPRARRALATFAVVTIALLALPLFVTGPTELLAQYRSWVEILSADAGDLTFARSMIVVLRDWTGTTAPNWLFQAVATLMLVAPLAVRRGAWSEPAFRRQFFASLLIYVVIFNHQAENASYVIAAVGLAMWVLTSPKTWPRVLLMLLCLVGFEAVPYAAVWLWLQFDLLDGARVVERVRRRVAETSPAPVIVPRSAHATARAVVPEAVEA